MRHPGVGREQLCFPPAAGEPRSPALAPASLFNVSRKGELHPPWGSSPQLLNCRLLAPAPGMGCSSWGSRPLPEIHPRAVTQVVESPPFWGS